VKDGERITKSLLPDLCQRQPGFWSGEDGQFPGGKEKHASYIIETLERSQAAIVNLEEYRQFQLYREQRQAFFEWLDATAAQSAERNKGLTKAEVMQVIEQARQEVASVSV